MTAPRPLTNLTKVGVRFGRVFRWLSRRLGGGQEGLNLAYAKQTRVGRIALAIAIVAALAGASGAQAGGIADEPCPNARGEHTNTYPSGTVGAPYSLRFVESEGSGCGPGRQTFHLDSGLLPPGLILAPDGRLEGIAGDR